MNTIFRTRAPLPGAAAPVRRRPALAAVAAALAIAAAGLLGTRPSLAAAGESVAEPGSAASLPRGASAITVVAPSGPGATLTPAKPAAATDIVLAPFPGAIEVGRTLVAIEQGTLPISPPDRSDNSDDRISHVGLPYRGRVQLLQYRHAPDESPLLIARHYADQLRAQGFALLTVCEAPCRTPTGLEDENAWWARELDPSHQLGLRAFGDRGAYFIGYRRDAVVAVRVGMWDLNFGSAIKIIQSDALDLGPIERYAQGQRAKTAAVAAPPRPAPAGVQVVPPGAAAQAVAHGTGLVVVQLTALDKGCTSCAKASAAFDALSADTADRTAARFIRVAYASGNDVGRDAFARSQGVASVPFFLTFKDGEAVRRQAGPADADTLRAKLIDGLH
jgi:hypothetical protein